MCNRSEGNLGAVHIEYRQAGALPGKAYADKMPDLRDTELVTSNDRSRNRYGKDSVRTEVLAVPLRLVNPNQTKQDRLVFRKRIARASSRRSCAYTVQLDPQLMDRADPACGRAKRLRRAGKEGKP
jgi:hypothetical protein